VVRAYRSRRGDHAPESAISGARGAFEVHGLGGNDVRVVVSHALYTTTSVDDVKTGSKNLTIRLPRRTGLAGRIVDPEGEPLENFWINVKRAPHPGDLFDIGMRRRYSHEKGRFVVEGLDPGMYRLEIAAKGFAATLSGEISVPREHYADAGTIAVQRGGSIRGSVLDPDGEPLMGATVSLKPNNYRPSYFEEAFGSVSTIRTQPARTDINGRFGMLAVTPGVYQIEVRSRAYPPLRIDDVVIDDEAEVELGELAMPRGATIAGRIFTEDGARAAGAKVRIVKDDASFCIIVTADSEGRFEASPVPAGSYTLTPEFPLLEDDNFFSAPPLSDESILKGVVVGEGGTQSVNLTLQREWK
jgi:protocatechuate 3,4-dioxygenase beta subunit